MENRVRHVPVFIVGASVEAAGLASYFKEKVLVVEKTCLAGSEFVDAMSIKEEKTSEGGRVQTKLLKQNLEKRGAYRDGRLFLPAVSSVLFEKIRDESLKYSFLTRIVEIIKVSDGFDIKLYHESGLYRIHTSMIIDTTSVCESMKFMNKRVASKSLNALIISSQKLKNPVASGRCDVRLYESFFDNQMILSCLLEESDGWEQAREKLFTYWSERESSLESFKIAAVASAFQIEPSTCFEKIEERWFWIPSSGCDGVINAFEQGIQRAEELEEAYVLI